MSLRSSSHHYGAIAASIHWLSALAVLLMLISGLVMDNMEEFVPAVLPLHVTLGVLVGLLTIFRVVWWRLFDRHPQSLQGMNGAQQWAARLVHLGLYAAILVMVASGIGMVALTGAAPRIFSGGQLPEFDLVPPYFMHGLMSRLLIALVIGHVGAALWHHFIRRDGLIARMGFGG